MEYLIRGETLSGIADEVRRLSGMEEAMAPDEMKTALAGVEAGGGSSDFAKGIIDKSIATIKMKDLDGLTTIGERAFYNCKSLTDVELPDTISSIDRSAFNSCSDIKKITMPIDATLTYDSFSGVNKVEEVIITAGNTGVLKSTYTYYPWYISRKVLNKVTLQEGIMSIGKQMFYECSNIQSIIIPNSVTVIDYGAFMSCTGLTTINIPHGVTDIEGSAFMSCSNLNTIYIPNTITRIATEAFYSTSLTDVYYEGTEEEWSAIGFEGTAADGFANATIHYNTPM